VVVREWHKRMSMRRTPCVPTQVLRTDKASGTLLSLAFIGGDLRFSKRQCFGGRQTIGLFEFGFVRTQPQEE
jgi:hypothetical protein